MPEETVGIENLKKLIKAGCDVPKQIAKSGADGWQWTDGAAFIDEAFQIISVAKSFDDIIAEKNDLDEAETQQLKDYVLEEFDIPNDEAEDFIEDALMWGFSTISLVSRFKKLFAKKP